MKTVAISLAVLLLLSAILMTLMVDQTAARQRNSGTARVYFGITQSTAYADIQFLPPFDTIPAVSGVVDCQTNVVFTVTAETATTQGARLKVTMNRSMHPPGWFLVRWTAE